MIVHLKNQKFQYIQVTVPNEEAFFFLVRKVTETGRKHPLYPHFVATDPIDLSFTSLSDSSGRGSVVPRPLRNRIVKQNYLGVV